MKIVLDTHSSDPHFNGDCDCAVLDVTTELLEQVRRRAELAQQAARQDNDLCEMYYWDYQVNFYDRNLVDACQQKAVEGWSTDLEQTGHVPLPGGIDLAAHQRQRVECPQMVILCYRAPEGRDIHVAWMAIPKHGDAYVTTSDLPVAALEACAQGERGSP